MAVKLSESDFGTARTDRRHLGKLRDTYYPVLVDQIDDAALKPDAFFANYQIYRDIWLAACKGHEKDQVRFLLPKANSGRVGRLHDALRAVHTPLRSRVAVVYIEPLLERLVGDTKLGWYAKLLREKYVPA